MELQLPKSFNALKKEITSDWVLIPFNSGLKVQLARHASLTVVAGVLYYIIDGDERPNDLASRSLTPVERNSSKLGW